MLLLVKNHRENILQRTIFANTQHNHDNLNFDSSYKKYAVMTLKCRLLVM